MEIAVIGLGLMGSAMVKKLIGAEHTVRIYNRTQEKAEPLLKEGAQWANTPADAARHSDVVITMVTDPAAVRDVALGDNGILSALSKDGVHCDMSTVSPDSAAELADLYRGHGKRFVQSPVLGSTAQIAQATLLVFAGGAEEDVKQCEAAWKAFASRIWHLESAKGAAGAKLACNMLIAQMIMGLGQSLLFAKKHGVKPSMLLEMLGASAMGCAMYKSKGEKLLAREFAANFTVTNLVKDLTLASDAAQKTGLPQPFNALAHEIFVAAANKGWAGEDYSAALKVLEELAGLELR